MAGGKSDGKVVINVTLNTSDIERTYKQIGSGGKQAGQRSGKGLKDGISKGVDGATAKLGGLKGALGKIGSLISVAFIGRELVNFGKKSIELGSNVAEVENVVSTSFGNMQYKIEEFSKTSIQQFGMSQLAAKKTASTYMAMACGMQMPEEAASDMAIALTGLSGDVASFFNISQELADTKLKSVFTGETETLKDLGVVMTQTNLKAFAARQGINKNIEAMSQAELVTLRYKFVTEQLALANGDFAKTQNSWANQTRILSMQWQEFMSVIGQSLIQVLTPALRALNQMVAVMISWAQSFNAVTAAIFGKQELQAKSSAAAIGGIADASSSAASGQDKLASSTKKAAKEAKSALAPYDELHIIQSNKVTETDGQSAINPTVDDGTSYQGMSGEIGSNVKLSPEFEAVINKLKSIDLTPAKESLDNFFEAVKKFAEPVGEGLKWFFDNVLLPLAKWTIEKVVPTFLDLLSASLGVLTPILEAAKSVLEWLWKEFLQPIAEWTGEKVIEGLQMLTDKLTQLGDWISEHQTALEDFILVIGSFASAAALVFTASKILNGGFSMAAIGGKLATLAVKGFIGAVGFLTNPITLAVAAIGALIAIVVLLIKHWDEVKEIASKCWDWIVSVWEKAGEWFNTNVVAPLSEVWQKIKNIFSPATEWFKSLFDSILKTISDVFYNIGVIASGCWEVIKAAWNIASEWFRTTVIEPVSNFFNNMWDGLKTRAKEAWEGVKNAFSPVVDWFRNQFTAAWNAVKNVFSVGGKIFDGITQGITEAFKTVVNAIISGINKVVAIPFNGINSSLDKLRKTEILGLTPFASLKRISVPQIPRLATGAVIPPNREFMAVLGDQKNGRNLEAPESLIRKIVREESGSRDSGGDWHIYIMMPDGEIKAETIITAAQRANQRAGKTIIAVEG